MTIKETRIIFDDSLVIFEAELHGSETVSIVLTELQKDEEKSTKDHEHYEIRNSTEVFIDVDEAKSIVKALQYIIDEE